MILLQDIKKEYHIGQITIPVLKGINLEIKRGEYVSIMGASGSGKSTLMNIMGCLDRPSQGEYIFEGINLTRLKEDNFAALRNQHIDFVFQQFNLLPRCNALENVMLPLIYSAIPKSKRRQKALSSLSAVGLANYIHHLPSQLSGGQQQRVAIARALVNHPSLILADEPTEALDTETSQELMNLLTNLNQQGITIVIVTHEPDIASQTQRIIRVKDGLIIQ